MIEYLTIEQVIELHNEMLKRYGGLPGIRDKNLLWSAIDAPKAAMFGQEMYPSVYEKAAAYLYHLVCNHPFNDANKRTGYAVTLVFLEVNNAKQIFKKEELENLVVEIAKGKETKERITKFLETGSVE
jgi:death-on-curing protein